MRYLLIIVWLNCFVVYGQSYQSPLLQSVILHHPEPVMVLGKLRLVYEIHIHNPGKQPTGIKKLSLIGLKDHSTLISFNQQQLSTRLSRIKNDSASSFLEPGTDHVLFIEADFDQEKLQSFYHQVEIDAGSTLIRFDTLHFNNTRPVTLSNPLREGNWTAIYDPSWQRGHRRVFYAPDSHQRIPGRFAIDLIKIDTGDYAKGNGDSIHNWYGYGAEVLAVADGEIAALRSDFHESPTLSAHPFYEPEQATGNYISLKIAENRFVFYEHLQPGSILVRTGQKVKKGQVIAQLGFTGQTTGPHLHLHLADANSPLGAEGLPFVFERFELLGSFPDFSQFGKKMDTGLRGKRKKEFPPSNSVLRF